MVKLLLNHGAGVNALSGEYGCALQAASFSGHEHTVKLLLDHGADVNTLGGKFASALIAACRGGHQATAKVFVVICLAAEERTPDQLSWSGR